MVLPQARPSPLPHDRRRGHHDDMDRIPDVGVAADGHAAAGRIHEAVRSRPAIAFVVVAYVVSWSAWLPLLAAVQGWLPIRPWT